MSNKPDFNDSRNIKRSRKGMDRLADHERTRSSNLTDAQERYDTRQYADRKVQPDISDAGDQGGAPSPSSSEAEPER